VDIRLQPSSVRPPSFLSSPPNAEVISVTRSIALPRIVVQILDSNGNVDVQVSEFIKVRATGSHPSVAMTGNEAVVYNGEAHFVALKVDNVDAGILFALNFTAIITAAGVERQVNGKITSSGLLTMLSAQVDVFRVDFVPVLSYIGYAGAAVPFVDGAALPQVRVRVLTSAHDVYIRSALSGASSNQTIVADFAYAPNAGTELVGNSAPVIRGVATFTSLRITVVAGQTELPPLRFSLSGTALAVQTGALRATRLTENSRMAFDDESISFIYSEELNVSATGDVKLPAIQISLRNTLMQKSPPSTGLVITASIPTGGRARLSGNVVGVVNGIARFDALRFEQIEHDEPRPYVIRFTAGTQGGYEVASRALVTGFSLVSARRYPAYSMRFRQSATESFFTGQGQAAQVVTGPLRLPVQLELYDSANEVDTNTTTVQVEAVQVISTSGETALDTQTFTGGRITFSRLSLTQAQEPEGVVQLVFRAVASGKPVGGQVLVSGALNVTSIVRNFDIQFQSYGASLFSLPGQTSFATVGVALPPVVIHVVTSAQSLDTQSNELGITATADGGAILSGGFIRVSGGVAMFSELTFVSETPGQYSITFTVGSEGDAPAAGKTLATGLVTVVGGRTPDFRIRFQNVSYIAYAGHVMPVTLACCAMPNVSVEIVDSTHQPAANQTGEHPRLQATVALSGGFSFSGSSGPTKVRFRDGVAVFQNLRIDAAFNPVLTVCVESDLGERDPDAVNGQCVSSGALGTRQNYDSVGALRLLRETEFASPVELTRQYSDTPVTRGSVLRAAVIVLDSAGQFPSGNRNLPALSIGATSTIPLSGDTRVEVNRTSGVAYFGNLKFSRDFPLGISPIITFSVVLSANPTAAEMSVRPIATGRLMTTRTGQTEGVDVVAEILAESSTFNVDQWRLSVAKRLNIEAARLTLLYSFTGTSAAALAEVTEDTTEKPPEWRGVRVEIRFLPPLPTSRDTKTAAEVAALFIAFVPSCKIGELLLRRVYLKAADNSCDWYIFDSQMNGVRACIQARGETGYCGCHIPLFQSMGLRCLGLKRLTTLCLNTLMDRYSADCAQREIRDVCKLLQFPDVPRNEVAGSGMFLFLFFPPLVYLYFHGFFHKMARPREAKVAVLDSGRDEYDLL
jgi:hypothetical protein